MAKQHNWTTKGKDVDATENRQTLDSICCTNHLTPASEAEMDNLLHPGSVKVPTRAETIKRNSPGFVDPNEEFVPEPDWMDDAVPSNDAYEKRAVR